MPRRAPRSSALLSSAIIFLILIILPTVPAQAQTRLSSGNSDMTAPDFEIDFELLLPGEQRAWMATVAIETMRFRPGASSPEKAVGSGVVVASRAGDVLIATVAHVVPAGGSIRVRWSDGSVTRAAPIWHRRNIDLALLQAVAPDSVEVTVAERAVDVARAGARVVAIGCPSPLELSDADRLAAGERVGRYAGGRLVARRDGVNARVLAFASRAREGRLELGGAWLHTAPILPGSSGGPLVDREGAVLGIHVGSLRAADGSCRVEGVGRSCLHLAADLGPLWPEVDRWLAAAH